ncbi:hypothetical protein [Salinispora oceanensis]|uniref:hypothetical protein n=1 Tax=Salinispora oceanensis TaxID=1050199 RepID=UPI0003625462|nr:hypothetical protein [Salinispora oceanensis]
MTALLRRLQQSQLSVQVMTRLANVGVFLLASWLDSEHVAFVAFQGVLLAIPYTLIEALIGRPQSAGIVPAGWDREAWATRTAAVVTLPVAAIGFTAVSVTFPESSIFDRLLVVLPVLLQLPIEALFWSMSATRSRRRANLVPQLVAAGTLATAAFATAGLRLEVAAVPAQLAVLAWALSRRQPHAERIRPGPLTGVRLGVTYCVAAAADLLYVIALPAVAGVLAGADAIVVLRAMDLAFGPFHVALAATTREDLVVGRGSRFRTGARLLTVVLLVGISATVVTSPDVRGLLADALAAASLGTVAFYCAYKAALMVSTWLSTRHMIYSTPATYLASAIGSRAITFTALVVALLWLHTTGDLFLLLAVGELLVVAWFVLRLRLTGDPAARPPELPSPRAPSPTLVRPRQPQEKR